MGQPRGEYKKIRASELIAPILPDLIGFLSTIALGRPMSAPDPSLEGQDMVGAKLAEQQCLTASVQDRIRAADLLLSYCVTKPAQKHEVGGDEDNPTSILVKFVEAT